MEDLHTLWTAYCDDPESYDEDLGTFNEYGLSFDYVAPETFTDQDEGYFRYQLSYGGPSTEFRFWVDGDLEVYKVQYWFLDWFDGAFSYLDKKDYDLMLEIFDDFKGMGLV